MTTYNAGPEFLGAPDPGAPTAGGGRGKKVAIIAGISGAAVVIGGGALAATMFFSTGEQPTEILPADTIVYAGIDMDPSGAQKVEALKALGKFPAFTDATGLEEDGDPVEWMFNEAFAAGSCEGVTYADDVKGWLGQRAGIGMVDTGGEEPSPVFVAHVTDAAKAEEGYSALVAACGGEDQAGFVVRGDWALLAEDTATAEKIADSAEQSSLADDENYQRWTDEAGGDAILSIYVSDGIAEYADQITAAGESGLEAGTGMSPDVTAETEQMRKALEEFEGGAAALRFDDGGLEFEVASAMGEGYEGMFGTSGGEIVGSLPADTVAAMGFGLPEGWVAQVDKALAEADAGMTVAEGLETVGLTVEQLEAGLGEGMVVALGSGLDLNAVSAGGPEELPVGVKMKADSAAVDTLIGTAAQQFGVADVTAEMPWMKAEAAGDYAVISPNDATREAFATRGGLEGNEVYKDVVAESGDAAGVMFVNFNADDDWLVNLLGDAAEVRENIEPLAGLGMSMWVEDGVSHGSLKITTD